MASAMSEPTTNRRDRKGDRFHTSVSPGPKPGSLRFSSSLLRGLESPESMQMPPFQGWFVYVSEVSMQERRQASIPGAREEIPPLLRQAPFSLLLGPHKVCP